MLNEKGKKNTLPNAFFRKGVWSILSLFAFLFIWWLASVIVGNEYLLPNVFQTLKSSVELLGKTSFWFAFFSTFLRSIIAFIGSFVLGGVFALLAYLFPGFERFFTPIVSFLRSLPTMAILLIILLWSNPFIAPIIVAALVLFPLSFASIYTALMGVDNDLLEMSSVYRVPLKKRVWQLFLPSILPSVCETGARNLSFGLKLIVSAEVMANTFQSIGGEMQTAALYDQTALLFALTLTVFFVGYLLECFGLWLCGILFAEDRE